MHSLKVLILEDHPFQLMALHQMLNANGVFDVLTAETVESARQSLARRGRVDVAICDLQMPGADGLDLIQHLACTGLAGAVVLLSGAERNVLDSVSQLARQQGLRVLGSLQKPACAASVRKLLESYLDEPAGDHPVPPAPQCSEGPDLHALQPEQLMQTIVQWVVHFQPKVCLEGNLVGVEALVRWQHPELGLLAPGQFLPMIENAGLLACLTWHVLDQALELSAAVHLANAVPLPVAVNIAPQLLEQEDFPRQILAALARHGVPASALTLEIIEAEGGQLAPEQLEGVLRLRLAGCQLSIDDFGMGESNLQRLLALPFSELKLPSEFIRGMAEDERKAAVVAGALSMARRMDLKVVVEGVETVEDLRAIKALGKPIMQGYFIARPMSSLDLKRWIADREGVSCGQDGTA